MIAMSFLVATGLAGSHSKAPNWMDWELAGYVLSANEGHQSVALFDPSTHFYLIRALGGCGGSDLHLLLTRDRRYAAGIANDSDPLESFGRVQLHKKSLSRLSTSKGISIGDSESSLLSILGKPKTITRSGSHNQYRVFDYVWKPPRQDPDIVRTLEETYTFKGGKLIEIQFEDLHDVG